MAEDGVRVEVDPRQFAATLRAIKEFSPALATATRKRLRLAGADTVKAVQAEVLAGGRTVTWRVGSKGKTKTGNIGLRAGIANGTKMAIVAGKTRQGVSIKTDSSRLGPGQAAMVKAWNKPSFRHPVFDSGAWVSQAGRPYFGSVINKHKQDFADAVNAALADAVREMQA